MAGSPSGREGVDHGHTVVDGVLRRTSVSALQTADASTDEGCPRKWWYAYVLHRKEPQTDAQARGTRLHGEIEQYLRTGALRLSDQILRHMHMVPEPGSDLRIEHPTVPIMADGSSGLHLTPLRAAGIPVVGFIDLIDDRGVNAGGHDIEDTIDPPNTVQVTDWKFPGSMDFAKTGPELIDMIQMSGYAKYIFDMLPGVEHVRLSHGYMPVRGRGDKRTALVDREAVGRSWEHAESVARTIRDVAREIDPDQVPANRRACRAFRKLCMHAAGGYCTAGTFSSLRSICSATVSPQQALITKDDIMGLTVLDAIRGGKPADPTPQPVAAMLNLGGTLPATVTAPAVDPANAAAARAAEVARLAAEETAQRAARAFGEVCAKVIAHDMGFPALDGEAAKLYPEGRPSGQLGAIDQATGKHALVVSDVAVMAQILTELDAHKAAQLAQLAGTPPPTPTAVAAPPAAPVQAGPAAPALLSAETPPVIIPAPATGPAPTAPSSAARLEAAQVALSVPAAIAAEAPKKRGRKPKAVGDAKPDDGTAVDLLIDCTVEDYDVTSLHPLIDSICEELANLVKAADIRVAGNDTALGFGKWPGALAGRLREVAEQLPPGTYSIDARDSAIRAVAAEAISARVRATGGRIFRGVR